MMIKASDVVVVVVVVIGEPMPFGREQPDAYLVSIRHLAWPYETAKRLQGIDRQAPDRFTRLTSMTITTTTTRMGLKVGPDGLVSLMSEPLPRVLKIVPDGLVSFISEPFFTPSTRMRSA